MIVLIPPSEGKAIVRKPMDTRFEEIDFHLKRQVNQVIRLLHLIETEDLHSVYGTSIEKAERFHRQNMDVMNSRVWPAILRYTGVVYEHIGWESLDDVAKEYMEKHVRIFSGMFGMVTPKTLIPDYKLKMNLQSIQHHWRPILTEIVADEDLIIDLLPQVHRKAYKPPKERTVPVDFVVMQKGKRTAAGHYGKAVKGEFIRFLAEKQVMSVDAFNDFEYDGFNWDGKSFVKVNN